MRLEDTYSLALASTPHHMHWIWSALPIDANRMEGAASVPGGLRG